MRDHAKAVTLLSGFSQHPGTPVSPRQLTTMVGKLCDFSKVTFPNACHRAFCYCTSCHLTFPSQTYIQKVSFIENALILIKFTFCGILDCIKTICQNPENLYLYLFADFFQSIVVLSAVLLFRSSLLVTCRRGLLKEPLERSGFTRSLTSITLPQCSNMLT